MRTVTKIALAIATFLALPLAVSPVFAAAPDSLGPWADAVVAASQANTKGGQPVSTVNPARSNPTSTLGVAENDTVDSHFFSLGFGGSVTLSFDNGISSGVFVVEATNPDYPLEKAKVEISQDGSTWIHAGTITQDGTVTKPSQIGCAHYVRITDESNTADFSEATADGFDVDGVQAQGQTCTPPSPSPTPIGCCTGCATITQTNTSSVANTVVTSANTGNNTATFNTGGHTAILTGDVKQKIAITNTGNTNIATTSSGCCPGGNTSVTISGNGAGSHNAVTINSGTAKKTVKKLGLRH